MARKNTGDPLHDRVVAPVKSTPLFGGSTLSQEKFERRREFIAGQVERRQAREAESLVSVTVVGPNPISHGAHLYTQGQTFQLRSSLAASLVAQGRVTLNP
jgi:hypothetical protein